MSEVGSLYSDLRAHFLVYSQRLVELNQQIEQKPTNLTHRKPIDRFINYISTFNGLAEETVCAGDFDFDMLNLLHYILTSFLEENFNSLGVNQFH